MHSILSILMLVCVLSAVHFQPSNGNNQPPNFELKGIIRDGFDALEEFRGRDADAKAVISSRKLGLGFKAILLKPLLLIALAKIKVALLIGKPFVLLTLKKLLLKAALGKLLLKIPLILLGGKAVILAKVLALKFALVTKGLIGLKAPLALLFLGGFLKGAIGGTGLGLALGLAGSLMKLKGLAEHEEDYEELSYSYVPPGPSVYSGPSSYSSAATYDNRAPLPLPSATPLHSAAPSYSLPVDPSYSEDIFAVDGANNFSAGYGSGSDGYRENYRLKRGKRDVGEESEEEIDEDSAEDLRWQLEAARTNENAYLYMAAQFDEHSCGHRLICEVYQKPKESVTDDEAILQNIFGSPLSSLSEEDRDTPKEWYYRAAQIGTSNQGGINNQICAQFYPTCPYNAQQLIRFFTTEDTVMNEIKSGHQLAVRSKLPQSNVRPVFYHPRQPTISSTLRQR